VADSQKADNQTADDQHVASDLVAGTDVSAPDWGHIMRWLAREGTAADAAALAAWAGGYPVRLQLLAAMREAWTAAGTRRPAGTFRSDALVDRVWASVRRHEFTSGAQTTLARSPRPRAVFDHRALKWGERRGFRARWWATAAIALLALALGVGGTVWSGSHWSASGWSPWSRTYATSAGQREVLTLADGTELTLAPASRVRLARDYGRSRRDVYLEGEASFTVVHDARHPFVVHVRNALAQDLGTRFVVRSYPEDAVVRVVVVDGMMSLGGIRVRQKDRAVLSTGTLGEVDQAGVTHVTTGVRADDYTAWARGEVRFTRIPLRNVLAELGRWYDLEISADSSLMQRPVTASFSSAPSADVFATLAAALGAHWQRAGRAAAFTAIHPE
jgi:transmembrane sensor